MAHSYSIKNTNDKSDIQLLNHLRKNFTTLRESKEQGIYHYFDTFDWRLYQRGYHLYLLNQMLYLYQFTKKKIEIEEDYHSPFTDILLVKFV